MDQSNKKIKTLSFSQLTFFATQIRKPSDIRNDIILENDLKGKFNGTT